MWKKRRKPEESVAKRACPKRGSAVIYGSLGIPAELAAPLRSRPLILNALKLKGQARGDLKGQHFEATHIVQAVSWLGLPRSH